MKIRSNDGECEYHYIEESPNFYIAALINAPKDPHFMLDKKKYNKVLESVDVTTKCRVSKAVDVDYRVDMRTRLSILHDKSDQSARDVMHPGQQENYVIKHISAADLVKTNPKATCFVVEEFEGK